MILFFIIAAILVISLIGILLFTLYSGNSDQAVDLRENNVAIARQKKAHLEHALATGAMDQETFTSEVETLERRLATELAASTPSTEGKLGKLLVAGALCSVVPIAAGALYLKLGTPDALQGDIPIEGAIANSEPGGEDTAPDLATVIPQLEEKLNANPDDINGWKLLGRSYLMMGEIPKAEKTLRTALSHGHEDPDIWSMLAESTAMQKDGDLRGEPTELLEKAYAREGIHERSYLLLGVARQQTGMHSEAIELFNTILANSERGPEATAQIQAMITASETALGQESSPSKPAGSVSAAASDSPAASDSAAVTTGVTVIVSASEEALANSAADQSVFIYAKASSGPPMPLAVSRHLVKDLPIKVTLDDSMAMMPDLSIGKFDSVTIGARISKTGNAIAQPGDWFVEQENIETGTNPEIEIVINQETS